LRRFDRETGDEKQVDAFGTSSGAEAGEESSYAERMRRAELEREERRVDAAIKEKEKENQEEAEKLGSIPLDATPKKRRWDASPPTAASASASVAAGDEPRTAWEEQGEQKEQEGGSVAKKRRSRWDQTPLTASPKGNQATTAPAETPKRSRWDQTPVAGASASSLPSSLPSLPIGFGTTFAMTAFDKANRYLSDEELDNMLPTEGYEVVPPPEGYAPIRTPARKLQETPMGAGAGFMMQDEFAGGDIAAALATPELPTDIEGVGQLAFFKQEDAAYFAKILPGKDGEMDESGLSLEELKERKIMRLLLKIKNGTPPMRKTALRQITDKAREFGAGPLFDKILPLLMERTLEDQERHLLVKVIDRILYKLDDLVRPYVHKILVVIEPLLIDEDYYARVEGREIISNLSKAAGLAHMISTMRPDIDHVDEYVRNTTARAFAVVASALGIPSLLPFLKAVCRSKKSWQVRSISACPFSVVLTDGDDRLATPASRLFNKLPSCWAAPFFHT